MKNVKGKQRTDHQLIYLGRGCSNSANSIKEIRKKIGKRSTWWYRQKAIFTHSVKTKKDNFDSVNAVKH